MSKHKTIKLKPKEGRRARAGAPWIFSNEIEMDGAAKTLAPGSVVNVLFDDGQPVGTVWYGVAIPGHETDAITARLPFDRERIRQFSTITLLNTLRLRLLALE